MTVYEQLDSGIILVEYADSFAASIADMINKSAENWGGDTSVKTERQVIMEHSASSNMNVFLALDGEMVVGYCSLRKYFFDANTLYIPYLNVRPDYMGKKIGKALVLKALNRTIELGFPRLDLYTWAGNTDAIPLYKKCGFLWEDRPETNHLVNFIPQILKTGLFADFFKKADWYESSTREIKVVRDGVKVNGFEVFGYSWEHEGEMLEIGFERSGRLMRLIETNDYKIELMAEDHELAFGLSYECKFSVTNKTGKELKIKIDGVNDKNIMFDFSVDKTVNENEIFSANFFVGKIDEPINKWRIHPRLKANVEINGHVVTFGLGIAAKFPVVLDIFDEYKVKHPQMQIPCFLNIKSALPEEAEVKINIHKNSFIELKENVYQVSVASKGKTSIQTNLTELKIGYEPVTISYEIKLADGRTISFKKPLHYSMTNLNLAFYFENDDFYSIINGPWRFRLGKKGNEGQIKHLTNKYVHNSYFEPPELGKPYDSEFELIKPNIKTYKQDLEMILEAEYVSEKFEGMVLTQIFSLSAAGIISRKNILKNRGSKTHEIMINDAYILPIERFTVFKADGKINMNYSRNKPDGLCDALEAVDPESFEENWIFEKNPSYSVGVCWPPEYKPLPRYGSWITYEIDCGTLKPGEEVETGVVQYVYGLFDDFKDFRDYAMRTVEKKVLIPEARVEVKINDYNPILWPCSSIKLEIVNNRETDLDGDVIVTCGDLSVEFDSSSCEFEPEYAPIQLINTKMKFSTYEKTCDHVLFSPKGKVEKLTEETKLIISNGVIKFFADPSYAHVCNSLITIDDGIEWLNSKYPKLEPYAWFNPFLGGIRIIPEKMSIEGILKEEINACFTEQTDFFGNIWQGIKTTLAIVKNDDNKNVTYESYFLTLPGLPLMCVFFKVKNDTGIYWSEDLEIGAFLNFDDEAVFGEFVDKYGQEYKLKFGVEYLNTDFVNTAKLYSDRKNKIYAFFGSKTSGKYGEIDGDAKFQPSIDTSVWIDVAPGKTHTTAPLFLIISGKDLPKDSLDELERIRFDENN